MKKLLAFCLLFFLSTIVHAEQFVNKGPYVEFNAGYGRVKTDDDSISHLFRMKSKNYYGAVISPTVGYQFNPYFAVEGGYFYNLFSTRYNHLLDFMVKGNLPLTATGQVNLFAKLGLGTFLKDAGAAKRTIMGAVGMGYYINSQVEVTAQVVGHTSWIDGETATLIGVGYHF